MQRRQKQRPGAHSKNQAGSAGVPLPLQHNPPPSGPLAVLQAETEKLGMRGVNLVVQIVARDMPWLPGPAKSRSSCGTSGLRFLTRYVDWKPQLGRGKRVWACCDGRYCQGLPASGYLAVVSPFLPPLWWRAHGGPTPALMDLSGLRGQLPQDRLCAPSCT